MGSAFSLKHSKPPSANTTKADSVDFYESYLKSVTNENKIVVFSKTTCSYCTRAKQLLNDLKLVYKAIELDLNHQCPNENCAQLSTVLIAQTRMRTVPQIFINGKCIGGFDELLSLSKNDKTFFESLRK